VDEDMDGQIYLEGIEEGGYVGEMLPYSGITAPGPIEVSVEPAIVYQKVDISDKVKNPSEISQAEEDAKYGGGANNNGGAPTPPPSGDTVEYVESSVSVSTKEVEKPVLDGSGAQVYGYRPQLSAGGYLVDAAGNESDIIPTLNDKGYIVGAKRRGVPAEGADPAAEPQYVDCTSEVLDASGAPLMDGSAYRYRFDKVALTEIITETTTVYKGWQTIEGRTYYFDKNGKYVTGWQIIQGIQYFFSPEGVRGGSVGIDVSTWQQVIDWKKVKAAGIEFAIIRLGFRGYGSGALVLDDYFHRNMQGATAAGIKVGVYFFTQAINEREAVEEASMCLEYVRGYKLSYPIVIDIEDAGSSTARANSLTNEQRTKICIAFCETVRSGGYSAAVYANKYYFTSMLQTSQLNRYIIWLAHYTTASSSSYAGRYDIWQHSSTGRVNGISGNVDMNISYLSI
jgi:GH25 family lysozyme M1 (1,4-beta-N-acetylmuramidase)